MERTIKGGKRIEGWKARGMEGWPFKRDRRLEGWKDSLLTLNSQPSSHPYLHTSKRFAAFTMAEILISLTIIGIIAAITLPSLVGNIKEKAWATQRKALYSRMSQAVSMLPSLNGYGATGTQDEINQKAAQVFVSDGLSKVLQINNICDSTKLKDCGIPDKITVMGTNSKINFPTKLSELNPKFTEAYTDYDSKTLINPQRNINTNVAAFETKNGEGIAVYYNPQCLTFEQKYYYGVSTWRIYMQPWMCANFIYDLNGRKGPNKMGKDIGFMTALYPTNTEFVAPLPFEKDLTPKTGTYFAVNNREYCKEVGGRLPNFEEYVAMAYNQELLKFENGQYYALRVSDGWYHIYTERLSFLKTDNPYGSVRCVKR